MFSLIYTDKKIKNIGLESYRIIDPKLFQNPMKGTEFEVYADDKRVVKAYSNVKGAKIKALKDIPTVEGKKDGMFTKKGKN
jgi:hypothetical protein